MSVFGDIEIFSDVNVLPTLWGTSEEPPVENLPTRRGQWPQSLPLAISWFTQTL